LGRAKQLPQCGPFGGKTPIESHKMQCCTKGETSSHGLYRLSILFWVCLFNLPAWSMDYRKSLNMKLLSSMPAAPALAKLGPCLVPKKIYKIF